MMKQVLITGFGFIGRHVAKVLVDAGFSVAAMDRRPEEKAMAGLGVQPVLGDIRDHDLMCELVPHYDGVLNLAGLLGTSEMINDPTPAVSTNIIGALNIFDGCRRAKNIGRPVRCVQIGVGNHFMDNPYSITKSTAERFANMYNIEHGTDIRIVRVLNAYGEFQKHLPVRKIIPTFIHMALRNEPIRVFGDGEQIMDMIYVADVATILVAALLSPPPGQIISAGTGRRLTVNQIAQLTIDSARSTSKIIHVPMRPGEPEHSIVIGQPETLESLGIDPASLIRFEDGIARTVSWYDQNRLFIDA